MSQEIDHDNTERLAALLSVLAAASEADEEAVPIDMLDGYLTALICGPQPVSPLAAMDALFGEDWAAVLEEQEQTEAFVEALHVRWNEIAESLDPERLLAEPEAMHLNPLITEFDEATKAALLAQGVLSADQLDSLPAPGVMWAEGFMLAVEDFETDWLVHADDSQPGQMLNAMLLSIAAVALPEGEQRQAYIDEAYDEDVDVDQNVLIDDALFSAQDLRLFWLQNPAIEGELH